VRNWIRRLVQALSVVAFAWLFTLAFPLNHRIADDLYLRFDPLLAFSSMLAARQLIPTLVIPCVVMVVVGLLLGRVFCGWLCPLGALLDAWSWLVKPVGKGPGTRRLYSLKYLVLALVLLFALFAFQLAYWVDPLVLLTRAMALAVYPFYMKTVGYAPFVAHLFGSEPPLGVPPTFRLGVVAFGLVAVIFLLSLWQSRFGCRYLCPLGAFYGLLARFTRLKRRVSDKCTDCKLCVRTCRMGALAEEDVNSRNPAECILCLECEAVCPPQATRFGFRGKEKLTPGYGVTRRQLLASLVTAALVPAVAWANRPEEVSHPGAIRPPGAAPESTFCDLCVRCGECMKKCPTGGLQPALAEAGLEGLGTPVLVPVKGPCERDCNVCGQVCPTDAIRKFEVSEKTQLRIGVAGIDRALCLGWARGRLCLLCEEQCPYQAIYHVEASGTNCPMVDDTLCVGCGICENGCPVRPQAAIRVYALPDRPGAPEKPRGTLSDFWRL